MSLPASTLKLKKPEFEPVPASPPPASAPTFAPEAQVNPLTAQAYAPAAPVPVSRSAVDEIPLRSNFLLALLTGTLASLSCAALWAGITITFHIQLGYGAWLVGLIVGYAIRVSGQGFTMPFSILGSFLSLAALMLGNMVVFAFYIVEGTADPIQELQLAVDEMGWEFMLALYNLAFGGIIDYLFYFIAIAAGYKLSRLDTVD